MVNSQLNFLGQKKKKIILLNLKFCPVKKMKKQNLFQVSYMTVLAIKKKKKMCG